MQLLVDLTYRCSMGCSHCMSDCKPNGIDMPLRVLNDSIDFLTKYNINVWAFSGGEMYEHPEIVEILDLIGRKFNNKVLMVLLITNGRNLARENELFNSTKKLVEKIPKNKIKIQVTDDDRFYPDKLTKRDEYWLEKLGCCVFDTVPSKTGVKNECLYPQGRALENFDESYYHSIATKCTNVRLAVKQGLKSINKIYSTMASVGKFCTPSIAPDGSIKLGESALCPVTSSIYKSEEEIINDIDNFRCSACTWSIEKLKIGNPFAYYMLNS